MVVLFARDDPTQYEEIFLHCGTNFVNSRVTPKGAEIEIKQLIRNLSALFPDSRITFSKILPRFRNDDAPCWVNDNIVRVNLNIERFCELEGFSFFYVIDFERGNVQRMFAQDGLHLGYHGIRALTRALSTYIGYTHKY